MFFTSSVTENVRCIFGIFTQKDQGSVSDIHRSKIASPNAWVPSRRCANTHFQGVTKETGRGGSRQRRFLFQPLSLPSPAQVETSDPPVEIKKRKKSLNCLVWLSWPLFFHFYVIFIYFLQLKIMHAKWVTCAEIPANPCSEMQFTCTLHAWKLLYTH